MKRYVGTPAFMNEGERVPLVMVYEDGELVGPLAHHVRHSPTGFAWGYLGSGPAELARCILIDHMGVPEEFRDAIPEPGMYQDFKAVHVADWPMAEEWAIDGDTIEAWRVQWAKAHPA